MSKYIFLWLVFASPVCAGVYKWTDANGNVHFGDRPADNVSATELTIKSNNETGITNSSGNKKEREYLLKQIEKDKKAEAKKTKKRMASEKKRKKRCDYNKRRYQSHIQSNRSYRMSPDGERTYLSAEQREAKKRKISKNVSKYCR